MIFGMLKGSRRCMNVSFVFLFFALLNSGVSEGKMPVVIRFVFKFNVVVCVTVSERQVNTQMSSLKSQITTCSN